jgi:hypothetical protein
MPNRVTSAVLPGQTSQAIGSPSRRLSTPRITWG